MTADAFKQIAGSLHDGSDLYAQTMQEAQLLRQHQPDGFLLLRRAAVLAYSRLDAEQQADAMEDLFTTFVHQLLAEQQEER